jgi:hypothetical protein
LLRWSKVRFPRLVLPNGFIERDLVWSAGAECYHVQNLQELLCLHQVSPQPWVMPLVDAGMRWLLAQNLGRFVDRRRGCSALLAVLATYYQRRPSRDLLEHLVEATCQQHAAGVAPPVDLLTCSFPHGIDPGFRSLDPRLVPVGLGDARVLLINPTGTTVNGIPAGKWVIKSSVSESP